MEEQRLVLRAMRGDIEAFEILVLHYQDRVFRLCFRILKNEDDAKDVAQEAMFKIYSNLKKYRFRSSFSTWVYSLTKNAALDFLRKRKETIAIDDAMLEREAGIIPYESKIEREFENKERYETLLSIINALPEQQRQPLILKDIDGYTLEEVAEILNLPVGTVKSRIFRAREKLKGQIRL